MTEPSTPIDPSKLPQAVKAPRWHLASWLIWLIPVVAAIIGGTMLAQALLSRGPSVTINFKNAEGLEAGKTKIKFKDVDIGTVKHIALSDDHKQVVVTAQLVKSAESFLRQDSRFWVVRPRVGAGGISGLGTLLSGSYIGVDSGKSTERRDEFTGLDVPPFVLTGLAGRQFALHAEQLGSVDIGAPIFYRHIQVGQVAAYELDPDGGGVLVHVFVNAPYDKYVTTASRFWQASGIELSVDANGAKLSSESLAAIISGGISFGVPPDLRPGPPAPVNADFKLYSGHDLAMKHTETLLRPIRLYFNESVRGLSVGAPVDFRGIVVGEVTGIHLEYDKPAGMFRFPVDIDLYVSKLQSSNRGKLLTADQDDSAEVLDKLVAHGLRAQLKNGNLLTGQLYVGLDFFPNAPAARLNWQSHPAELATVPGTLEELQSILSRIARRLDKVPVEQIATELRSALKTLNGTLKSTDKLVQQLDSKVAPEAKATLEQVRKTFASADAVLASDAPLQQDLRETLRDVSRAAQSLRGLTDYLERHPESLIRGKKETP